MAELDVPSWLIMAALMFACAANSFSWVATIVAMLRYEKTPSRAIFGIVVPIYAFIWCLSHAQKCGLKTFRRLWIAGVLVGLPVAIYVWIAVKVGAIA